MEIPIDRNVDPRKLIKYLLDHPGPPVDADMSVGNDFSLYGEVSAPMPLEREE